MSKTTTSRPATDRSAPANPFGLPLGAFGPGDGHGMGAWMQMNRAMLEGFGRIQQEAGQFVVRRLEEDMARQQQILGCRSPQDAWQIYSDFIQKAVQDYSSEAEQLSRIVAEVQYSCAGFGEMLAGAATETTVPVDSDEPGAAPRKSAA